MLEKSELEERQRVRQITKRAIARGEIIKKDSCEWCGSNQEIQCHHSDYSKPLEVLWVCKNCHIRHHNTPYDPDAYITPKQAAEHFGVHYNTILSWIKSGSIKFIQPYGPGGRLLIPR